MEPKSPRAHCSRSRSPPLGRNGSIAGDVSDVTSASKVYDDEFFEQDVDRNDFFTVKYGLRRAIFGPGADEAIPLWVADMDLPCATEICTALRQRTEHQTFGYTYQPSEIWDAARCWLEQEHSWAVQAEDFVFASGVVTAAAACIWAFSEPGSSVVLMTPLYEPLQKVVEGAGRRLVKHELELSHGRYVLDRERLQQDLQGCRILLFCNPHNPGGRVWTSSELRMVAELCKQEGVLVVSDEIWADWALFGHKHRPLGLDISESQELVTLMAPTKTWNLAGLHCSFLVITNKRLRERYLNTVAYAFLHYGGTFATSAMLAAYTIGRPWLRGVKRYVEASLNHCEHFLKNRCAPEVLPLMPEATYLLWLDCTELGVQDPQKFFQEQAGVLLSGGAEFGGERTAQFVRLNAACRRNILTQALERIAKAVEKRRASLSQVETRN